MCDTNSPHTHTLLLYYSLYDVYLGWYARTTMIHVDYWSGGGKDHLGMTALKSVSSWYCLTLMDQSYSHMWRDLWLKKPSTPRLWRERYLFTSSYVIIFFLFYFPLESSLSPKPKVLSLPVSQTGRCGFVTMNILQLCGSIREKGVPLVLISGRLRT